MLHSIHSKEDPDVTSALNSPPQEVRPPSRPPSRRRRRDTIARYQSCPPPVRPSAELLQLFAHSVGKAPPPPPPPPLQTSFF